MKHLLGKLNMLQPSSSTASGDDAFKVASTLLTIRELLKDVQSLDDCMKESLVHCQELFESECMKQLLQMKSAEAVDFTGECPLRKARESVNIWMAEQQSQMLTTMLQRLENDTINSETGDVITNDNEVLSLRKELNDAKDKIRELKKKCDELQSTLSRKEDETLRIRKFNESDNNGGISFDDAHNELSQSVVVEEVLSMFDSTASLSGTIDTSF